ncbi:Sua5/YciO/YrdC/YwlC family protein [Alteromonas sp. LMIT006]|jgi:L-threonylcarbamoyladenylate synthase|uniref:Sua5/YciO/YrdC/YwlC family protein n=1 Tax=Alteromonadaceae TaxID=72275 RepID=UPI0020CA7505|nr:Sua5/YciO/YrdC/YwlC family protein [Alteromonas sp. LMIT006]UTP73306.1 Sua5/YciO/YrdC/YwlC family protein [Alteromonas sp. LMIT006]
MKDLNLSEFCEAFQSGQVIAYPTEAVFGLGCDPDNLDAVQRVLDTKTRPQDKGVILIASHFAQLEAYVDKDKLTAEQWQAACDTWPGPYTWIIPKRPEISDLLSGGRNSLAVRVSAHPTVKVLCDAINKPMVSTSANPSGKEPARDLAQIKEYFGDSVYKVDGEVDRTARPSKITDALTGVVLRD